VVNKVYINLQENEVHVKYLSELQENVLVFEYTWVNQSTITNELLVSGV